MLAGGASYARKIRQLGTGGLILTEEFHAPDRSIPSHAHERAYVSVVLGGWMTEYASGYERILRAHDVSFHPARSAHEMWIGPEGAWTCCIELDPAIVPRMGIVHALDGLPPTTAPGMWLLYRGLRQSGRCASDALATVLGTVMELGEGRGGDDRGAPPWLTGVIRRLDERFRQRLTVVALAEELGMHPFHLGAVFKAKVGVCVADYVRALRIRDCLSRLQFDDAPVAEIAYVSGFADQSHMTRSLKANTGWTPAVFRKTMRSAWNDVSAPAARVRMAGPHVCVT